MQYKLILLSVCFGDGINMASIGTLWVDKEYPCSFDLLEFGWLFGRLQLKIFNKPLCGDYPSLVEDD